MIPIFLTKLFAGKAKEIASTILEGADKLFTSKEQKAAFELKAEQELNRAMEAMRADIMKEYELEIQDRDSARKMAIEQAKSTGHADYFQYFIGTVVVVAMVGIIVFILNKEIPAKNEHVVMLVIGEILGITAAVYSFYYGSSAGSRIKDKKP